MPDAEPLVNVEMEVNGLKTTMRVTQAEADEAKAAEPKVEPTHRNKVRTPKEHQGNVETK